MKVYLGKEKKIVEVELLQKRKTTYVVKLPSGDIITRKERQVVKDEPTK